jgi:signal transduction histidine kinase
MRSLTIKLVVAFLFVSLIGIVLVAFLAGRITANEFGNFVDAQNQELIINQLADYYEANNGWQGTTLPNPHIIGGPGRGPGGSGGPGRSFALADEHGVVIVSGIGFRRGQRLPDVVLESGLPIEVDGDVVGTLILPGQIERGQFRDDFISRVNFVLLFATLGATAVSLVLGVVLARGLTRPLKELTAATRKVAAGDLSAHVSVRSGDELGELATSFNQMNAELARGRDLRRQMTADIAHDLRTPLSIILGHAEALSEGVLPATPEALHIVHDEARRLNRLVEDLRTLSLAEAGELSMIPRPVAATVLLERAVTAHTQRAQERGVTLTTQVEPNLPDVSVDPDRMAQVIDNLLNNALQYTPENGRILLSASGSAGGVQLRVQDSGPGLTAAELAHVFDRFYRGDGSRQRQEGNSGLGLAIARSIVVAHNGRIWAESQPGAGATFVIELPAVK